MGVNEGPNEETDQAELSLDYINNHSTIIFTAEVISFLLNVKQSFLADHYELLPPLSAEIQEIGTETIILYYKDQSGDFKEITFKGANFIPKIDLIQKLNEIGFNIELNQLKLFGIPALEAIILLREQKNRLIRKGLFK